MKKTKYNVEEVNASTLEYFNGDELAVTVWRDKYALKEVDPVTKVTTYLEQNPDDMHRRMAIEFARIEEKYPNPMSESEIYELFKNFKYVVPQGSPMAGIGNSNVTTSISNCFVIGGQPDSYGGIMNLDEEGAQLMKRRGGVGNSMDFIRPSGSLANGTPLGDNAGMPLYMERYSNTTREVQQDGRRGARMLAAHVKHPDIIKFIDKKMTEGAVTGANVSVKITDEFKNACDNGLDFYQIFPTNFDLADVQLEEPVEYDKLYTGKVINGIKTYYKKTDPTIIQAKLVYNAWRSAEPGSLFWDKILNESPARGYGDVWTEVATNPCGEIPLPPYDSCRLLVLNLMGFVFDPFGDNAALYDELLVETTKKAQRLMDGIVDLEIEKINAIIKDIKNKNNDAQYQAVELNLWTKILGMAEQGRRTGLGITAEGDLIAALGYKYGTPEASLFSEKLHQLMATASYESSVEMAKERGTFPIWNAKADSKSEFIQRMFGKENELMTPELLSDYKNYGRRNIANLTIAPTGSVSILTQTTSGIEPLFSPYYFRKKKITTETYHDYIDEVGDKWVEFPVFHRPFVQWYSVIHGIDMDLAESQLMKLGKEELDMLFKVSPYFLATAQDVDYVEKVRMQGAVQKWVDHSISVTVNMPEDVTEQIVADVYKVAHESGCKGITVYRDNSRGNVLSTESIKDAKPKDELEYTSALERPKSLDCDIYHKTKAGENFIILVGLVGGKPYEIFSMPDNDKTKFSKSIKKGTITKIGKQKYNLESDGEIILENITSFMIESEQNSTRNFSAMLRHRMDPKFIVQMISQYASISSFHKVVGKVLTDYIELEQSQEGDCPAEGCGGTMVMTEGCMKCPDCGYAHCG